MNKGLKTENIEEYIRSLGRRPEQQYVYAQVSPGTAGWFLFGAFSAFMTEYYIAVFNPEEVILLPMSAFGNFKGEPFIFDKRDIQSFIVDEGSFNCTVHFRTYESDVKLQIPKRLLRKSWQAENLLNLRSGNWLSLMPEEQ